MVLKIIILIIGLAFLGGGFVYSREDHEKYTADGFSSAGGSGGADSLIVLVFFLIIGFFVSITHYYVMKSIILTAGVCLLIASVWFL